MVISRTAAKKTTAPAKKAVPAPAAKRTAAKPVVTATKAAPVASKAAVAEKVTGHDVARAALVLEKAQTEYNRTLAAYWAQNETELEAAVEHSKKTVESMSPPVREGRKPADTPSAKARAKTPVIDEFYDQEKTTAMGLRDLRELAAELAEKGLITELKVKKTILEQMEEAGLFRAEGSSGVDEDDAVDDDEDVSEDEEDEEEFEEDDSDSESEDDDESDEDSDDEDAEDEDGFTLDDLKAMKLKELQNLAEQNSVDWDGLTKSELIAELWGDDEEEDDESSEEDAEDADDDEEEGEEEEETVEIDLADLPKYSADELYEIAKQVGAKIPVAKRKDKKFLIQKVTEVLTEDDE